MQLKEVLTVIDADIVLEIASEVESYNAKSAIPQNRLDYIVKAIKPLNKSILIILSEPPKSKTLEELGYSFEAGM